MIIGDQGRRMLAFNRLQNATTRKEKADALRAIRKLKTEQMKKFNKDGSLKRQFRKAGGAVMKNRGGTFKGVF
tara:strand:- start:406 stop:624 length:219 start_codon:yes stop_codon:yes gene_type:complete